MHEDSTHAQSSDSDQNHWQIDHPERIKFETAVRSLRLSVSAGRINLVGSDGPTTLEVSKISGSPLHVELHDGNLVVRHSQEGKPPFFPWFFRGEEIELSLAVSPDCLVNVNMVSGALAAANFHEQFSFRGVTSEVTLAEVHGSSRVSTVSGAVTAEEVTGDLDVKAITGAITVIASASGTLNLSTISGAITVDAANPLPDSLYVRCVSGAITVRLPHSPDVHVDMSTANGTAISAFPELSSAAVRSTRRLTGQLGNGTSQLSGKTVSGSITVLRRAEENPLDAEEEES